MKHADGDKASDSTTTRRQFLGLTAAAALAGTVPGVLGCRSAVSDAPGAFDSKLLPPIDEIWRNLQDMTSLGPRYTGTDAHRQYVDSLAAAMTEAGLTVARDGYTLPRWQPKQVGLTVTPRGGGRVDVPVTSYYAQSGETGPAGTTGPLAYAGTISSDGAKALDLPGDVKGRIVVVDYEVVRRDYGEWYRPWGFYTEDTTLPAVVTSIIAVAAPLLAEFKKAGAAGVVFRWVNLSDEHASNQRLPFGRPLQGIPAIWVGRDGGARLAEWAKAGATATLTLDADVFPDTATDTLMATLEGTSAEEMVMITTHTDGPNAIQENGGIALRAMAKYFSRLPLASRKRTLVFVMTTGHYAGAYVPSIRGFIEKHPEIIRKAVASVTIEHLGCREWLDDDQMRYAPTGRDDVSFAVTRHETVARLMLESLNGTADRRAAVVAPTPKGRYLGEGGNLSAAGLPALGYFAGPSYLNMEASDGCIGKLSRPLFEGQVTALTKLVQALDATPAATIKA